VFPRWDPANADGLGRPAACRIPCGCRDLAGLSPGHVVGEGPPRSTSRPGTSCSPEHAPVRVASRSLPAPTVPAAKSMRGCSSECGRHRAAVHEPGERLIVLGEESRCRSACRPRRPDRTARPPAALGQGRSAGLLPRRRAGSLRRRKRVAARSRRQWLSRPRPAQWTLLVRCPSAGLLHLAAGHFPRWSGRRFEAQAVRFAAGCAHSFAISYGWAETDVA